MREFNAFVSPEYPVLHSVAEVPSESPATVGHAALSLGLIVNGIPSFLATIPIAASELDGTTQSLMKGNVRVAAVGISVDESDLAELDPRSPARYGDSSGDEPWKSPEEGKKGEGSLPAAFLSLVCSDSRRIGLARIVARQGTASPEDVARFVLEQIAKGVQIADLASTP